MLDYDHEAAVYDRTRGGDERADAAAEAIGKLLPAGAKTIVDVACGTAIVSTRLRAPGRTVVGVDRAAGMLSHARPRLDGNVAVGDATRLPCADASVDAVTYCWLLHLLDAETANAAIADAARVLRTGGMLITTVNKNFASYATPSDVSAIVEPAHRALVPVPPDGTSRVVGQGARHGLALIGETTFAGHGQGRSSARWVRDLVEEFTWFQQADQAVVTNLTMRLAGLPQPDRPRPDPVYQVVALAKSAPVHS